MKPGFATSLKATTALNYRATAPKEKVQVALYCCFREDMKLQAKFFVIALPATRLPQGQRSVHLLRADHI